MLFNSILILFADSLTNTTEVIVRMSDFKTNEYASLLGGSDFGKCLVFV